MVNNNSNSTSAGLVSSPITYTQSTLCGPPWHHCAWDMCFTPTLGVERGRYTEVASLSAIPLESQCSRTKVGVVLFLLEGLLLAFSHIPCAA